MKRVLESPLRYPILFTCNIRRTVHESFGLSHYKHLRYHGLKLIPIITDPNSGIERRAAQLTYSINKYLNQNKIEKAHVVSHSLSGLDMRYALSSLGLSERVHTLTTIATPHKYPLPYPEDPNSPISTIRSTSTTKPLPPSSEP